MEVKVEETLHKVEEKMEDWLNTHTHTHTHTHFKSQSKREVVSVKYSRKHPELNIICTLRGPLGTQGKWMKIGESESS